VDFAEVINNLSGLKPKQGKSQDILKQNDHLNFAIRALNPHIFPVVNNPDGSVSTHRMAANGIQVNGKNVEAVYPTIIQTKDGRLIHLSDQEAIDYAIETGNYIPFDDPEEAHAFARGGYKSKFR